MPEDKKISGNKKTGAEKMANLSKNQVTGIALLVAAIILFVNIPFISALRPLVQLAIVLIALYLIFIK